MKQFVILAWLVFSFVSCASCNKTTYQVISSNNINSTGTKMKITAGNSIFTVTLYDDNATVTTFKSLLPMTVTMLELNANEKYVDLSRSLPVNAFSPGTIQAGDLMLYGSSTLVLFYKTFASSYSYTKIGRIENPSGLATALGAGNVSVLFELQ